MRSTITHALLSIFVITLVVSNVILATKVTTLREETSALIAANATSRTDLAIPAPTITSLSPDYGSVGAQVKIHGTGFSAQNNTVYFDYGQIAGIASDTGTSLVFTVPAHIAYVCPAGGMPCPTNTWQKVVPRAYSVAVGNAQGKSNTVAFLVTETIPVSKVVKITSLAPSAGTTGIKVTIQGSGFTRTKNTVMFNYHKITGIPSSGAKKLVFTVPAHLVYPCIAGAPCPTNLTRPVIPGTYSVRVSNSRGTSNSVIFIVNP